MSRPEEGKNELILALETSLDVCGVAVWRGGRLMAERAFRHEMHLSERLLGHCDGILADADALLEDVTAFAVGIGPGSFTGTRIGVMTIKTLATVLHKPVFGVNGLTALAAQYAGLQDTLVAPLLPCRAGYVYTAFFDVDALAPKPLLPPAALSLPELVTQLDTLEPRHVVFCGVELARHTETLRDLLEHSEWKFSFGTALFPRAADIAQLAHHRQESGDAPDDPLALVPLYISPPPITQSKQQPTRFEKSRS